MNKSNYYNTKNKKAVTLMEIMLAVVILAFTFIPIIGTLLKSTKDTDVTNSYVYAQTVARNVLTTLLDDVPFHSIQKGSSDIGKLVDSTVYNFTTHSNDVYSIKNFKNMIGNYSSSSDLAQGTLTDERGVNYTVTIYVYPIEANTSIDNTANELKFNYMARPKYNEVEGWYTYTSVPASVYRVTPGNPYDISDFSPLEKSENAFKLGAKNNAAEGYCVMKKIVLTIDWTAHDGHRRNIALYTMKANLDSES